MMSESFRFELVDDFTAGSIGQPGERVFYLQAVTGERVTSFRCEKQQVGGLGEAIDKLLEDLQPAEPAAARAGDLRQPVVSEWSVAGLGLAYDQDTDRVVVYFEELVDDEDDEETDPASTRLELTRAMARAFVERAADAVAGGRPPCRWCGRPIDPAGHACPRMN
jgi:uncharacterized repeat protein (TIGR03847 family)